MIDDALRSLTDARRVLSGDILYRNIVFSGEDKKKIAYAEATIQEMITVLEKRHRALYRKLYDLEDERE